MLPERMPWDICPHRQGSRRDPCVAAQGSRGGL